MPGSEAWVVALALAKDVREMEQDFDFNLEKVLIHPLCIPARLVQSL